MTLREEIAARLPQNAFLRVDRTERALYAAAMDDVAAKALQSGGWTCTPAGRIWLIAPGIPQLQQLRAHADASPQWQRFADRPADESVLPLLCAVLRALDMPPTPPAYRKIEKLLRQTTAGALRTGGGGGLEICETLFRQIHT